MAIQALPAIIQGIAAVGSAGINAASTGATNWKSYKYSRKLANHNFDLQTQQWNRENEYNLPENQRARLEAGGLSPSLFYSGGAANAYQAGGLSSVASPTFRAENPGPDIGRSFQQLLPSVLEASLLEAQAYKAKAEGDAALANAGLSPGLKQDALKTGIENTQMDTEVKRAIAHNTKLSSDRTQLDTWIMQYTAASTVEHQLQAAEQMKIQTLRYMEHLRQDQISTRVAASTESAQTQAVFQDLFLKTAQTATAQAVTQLTRNELAFSDEDVKLMEQYIQSQLDNFKMTSRDRQWQNTDKIFDKASVLIQGAATVAGAKALLGRARAASAATVTTHTQPSGVQSTTRTVKE